MKAKYLLIVLPLLATLAFGQTSETGAGGQSGIIFELGGSARSLAMGQAYNAIADEGECMLYNPAGLGQIRTTKIGLMGGLLYAGAMQSVVTANMPLATYGTVGLTYSGAFSSLDDGDILDPEGNPVGGSASMNNSALMVSYGKKFRYIGVGLSPKIMLGVLHDESAFGFDADFGAIIYPASINPDWNYDLVTIGVSVKNLLGSTMSYTDSGEEPAIPRILRAGVGVKILEMFAGDFDISLPLGESGETGWYGGLEFTPVDIISLRGGVNHNSINAGMGLHFDLARSVGMDIDYAFMYPYAAEPGFLDPLHKVSFNVELRSVAGLWVTVNPSVLTSTEYADIAVYGASQYYGKTKRWVFEIYDKVGTVVYRQSRDVIDPDLDALPSEFKWSGLDNMKGGQVKNGWYFYRFTIIDNLGDQIVYKGKLLKVER
ncbi:hypothetical protein GF359_01575 [candidate division WOR-3 bacterium]|uniref:PorV/PorQ family protein n=1 Tax=candidate division WOR-3 bacterium TaxID=2052148 RepID=A0A9D5QBR6_UNCW3|nr:hypothetical protein [candidate division WOR-3 bacterium]MBD3363883.1 hypothetical protein [candidate division WOR-3 bacterium]